MTKVLRETFGTIVIRSPNLSDIHCRWKNSPRFLWIVAIILSLMRIVLKRSVISCARKPRDSLLVNTFNHLSRYGLKLIHSADPVIIIFAHVSVRMSVPTFQNFAKQKKHRVKIMIATGRAVGLAEWIIDDTCLVLFRSDSITLGVVVIGLKPRTKRITCSWRRSSAVATSKVRVDFSGATVRTSENAVPTPNRSPLRAGRRGLGSGS